MAMAISSSSKNLTMFDHHKSFPMGLGLGFPSNPTNISLKSFIFFPNSPKHPYQLPNITETYASNSHDQYHQPPHFNFFQKVASMALDILEKPLLSNVNLPKTSDPRVQIAGNYAPVSEQPVHHSLLITGTIPNCINGVYLRNGANPLFEPVAGHHLFDGDGMVHAVTINEGTASYGCRFTQTHRLIQEQKHGRPVFPKSIGELHGHTGIARLLLFFIRGIFGLIDHNHGTGVANAGLVFFNGHLLAMSEDDLPYHLHITSSGDLITAGRYNFDDQIDSPMIPHPKIDPDSGELFTLSYNILHKPYLKYFRFSKDGKKLSDVEIVVKNPTMIHDFAITENFVVIPDQKMVFNLHEMVKGGSPLTYDKNKISRFGILPKNAAFSSEIIWVNSEDSFCFHFWNAWEDSDSDSDEIIMIGSCMTPPDSIFNEHNNNDVDDFKVVLSEIRLDLKTRKTTCREMITGLNLEAGTVNRNFLGRKTRYVYLAITEPWPKASGFAKVDIEKGEVVKKYVYGDGRFGGEPYFVEREVGGFIEREDDGYVMVFVHDEKKWKSELLIVNAMDLELEACVEMPSRVPYGFHATFVHAKDLASQA